MSLWNHQQRPILFLLIFYSLKMFTATGKQSIPDTVFVSVSVVQSVDK